MLCTTSWSIVGAAALVPYLALVSFGRREKIAAWGSALAGFASCLFWYLCVARSTAVVGPVFPALAAIPPFFAGLAVSVGGWGMGLGVSRLFAASGGRASRASSSAK
jgi:hypothetical protein